MQMREQTDTQSELIVIV